MNKHVIRYTLGKMIRIEGLLMLLPALVGLIYREKTGLVYLATGLVIFILGHFLGKNKPKKDTIYPREGFLIVALSWLVLSFFGAFPFYLTGEMPHFIDAFFEIVSGFTTTGSSILTNIESLSHPALFWRSFSHWIGGMGILVFVVAFLRDAPGTTMNILKAEMPGPIVGKLVSKTTDTTRLLYIIYSFMTILQVILLMLGGMSLFDSLLNSFGTAGTGGFAIKNASIAYYNNAYYDGVITVFMILFGINFNVFYLMAIRKFKEAFKCEEMRWYLLIIAVSVGLITINITSMYHSVIKAFRFASFQVASIITTTGYATADFDKWSLFSKTILVLLMFVGACAGSTGGGMKVSRIVIYIKNAFAEMKHLVHPHSIHSIRFENKPIHASMINNIHTYMVLYFMIFCSSLLIIAMQNIDFTSAFTAVATCLNNVGPGLNLVGPTSNFSSLSDLSKLVLSFDMLAGRLEIFPMLMIFSKTLWKR